MIGIRVQSSAPPRAVQGQVLDVQALARVSGRCLLSNPSHPIPHTQSLTPTLQYGAGTPAKAAFAGVRQFPAVVGLQMPRHAGALFGAVTGGMYGAGGLTV
jgi:hypothetical protein